MISVCLPTYNRSEYLAEAIDSIINQSYKFWELIIIDDGSTDSTKQLLDYYVSLDERIQYHSTINQGIAKARNLAVSLSQGEYIMVMDSDDLCGPDRMKRQLKQLEKGFDVSYSSYLRADENATVIDGVKPPKPSEITKETLLKDQGIPHVTILARKKCFVDHPYRDKDSVNDDYFLVQSWIKAAYKLAFISDPLVIVRFHEQNTSRTQWEAIKKVNEEVRKEINESF